MMTLCFQTVTTTLLVLQPRLLLSRLRIMNSRKPLAAKKHDFMTTTIAVYRRHCCVEDQNKNLGEIRQSLAEPPAIKL